MTNFLQETIDKLIRHNKKESDVRWVNCSGYYISWDNFKKISNIEYDPGYGSTEIPEFKVVGDDWWLERAEYDGSEWWDCKTIPIRPEYLIEINSIQEYYLELNTIKERARDSKINKVIEQ